MTAVSEISALEDILYDLLAIQPELAPLLQFGDPSGGVPAECVWIPGNAGADWQPYYPGQQFTEDVTLTVKIAVFQGGDSFTATRERAQALCDVVTTAIANDRRFGALASDSQIFAVHRASGVTVEGRGVEMTISVKVSDEIGQAPGPFGDCTGVGFENKPGIDQTDELIAAFASVPNGGEFCFEPLKTYTITGKWLTQGAGRSDVTIHGNGADLHTDFIATDRSQSVARFEAKDWDQLQVHDLFVSGILGDHYDSRNEEQTGFHMIGCTDWLISGGGARHVGGDVLSLLGNKDLGVPDSGGHATGLVNESIGRMFLSIVGSLNNVEVDHFSVDKVGRSFVDIELINESMIVDGVNVHDGSVGSIVNSFLANQAGGETHNVSFTDITAPTIDAKVGVVRGTRKRSHFHFLRCIGTGTFSGSNQLIRCIETDDVTVDYCSQALALNKGARTIYVLGDGGGAGIGGCGFEVSHGSFPGGLGLFAGGPPPGCTWTDGGGNTF